MLTLKQITEKAYSSWNFVTDSVNKRDIPFRYNLQVSSDEYPEEFDEEDEYCIGRQVIDEAVLNSLKSLLNIREIPQILHLKADEIPQKQPRIDVKLKKENKLYRIAIEDNGPGIAQQNLERIWEVGFSTFETSGFGLVGMKLAVDKYCGRIEVESTPFVKTAFNIYIPSNAY